jgi:hypothetical protein
MSSPASAKPRTSPVPGGARRAAGWPLALICAAQFVLQLDFSIVNIALPSIQAELHVTAASLQWIITGYALTYGSLLLTGGRIGDLAGRRIPVLHLAVPAGQPGLQRPAGEPGAGPSDRDCHGHLHLPHPAAAPEAWR